MWAECPIALPQQKDRFVERSRLPHREMRGGKRHVEFLSLTLFDGRLSADLCCPGPRPDAAPARRPIQAEYRRTDEHRGDFGFKTRAKTVARGSGNFRYYAR